MFKIIKNILLFIFDVLTIIFEFTIGWLMLGLLYLSYIIQDFYEDKIKTLPEKIFIKSTKYFINEQIYKYPNLTEHKIKIKYFYIPFKKNNVTIKIYINEQLYIMDKLCGCNIDNAIEILTDQFQRIHFDYINNIKFKIKLL